MEYKKGDIIKIINLEDEELNNRTPVIIKYSNFLFTKGVSKPPLSDTTSLITKGIFNESFYNTWTEYNVVTKNTRLANKEDLKEYLQFIFTNEKIWIKYSNSSEGNTICKIINRKYPYDKLILPEDIENHDRFYFNRVTTFQNINEEEWLRKGYSIIEFKDIKYIIQKINEKI